VKFDLNQEWKTCRFAAFDLETTGTDVENDRITEIGLVVFEGGEIVDRYSQLINPGIPIPAEVTEVTGITDADVADQPSLEEVADTLVERLGAQVLVAYNHSFDQSVVTNELKRIGRDIELPPFLDPFPFAWEHLREPGLIKNAKLTTVAEFMEISLESAHRAVHDAEATGYVMMRLPDFAVFPTQLGQLLQVQRVLIQKVESYFARFRRGKESARSVLAGGELVIELGAAYVYGPEADPVRALFNTIPDVRDIQAVVSR